MPAAGGKDDASGFGCLAGVASCATELCGGREQSPPVDAPLAQAPPSLARTRFLVRWARLKLGVLELGNAAAAPQQLAARQRLVVDHVLSESAPWAARLTAGDPKEKESATKHLARIVRFLNKAGVATVVSATNALSASQFAVPRGSLDAGVEACLRSWHERVLPTLAVLGQVEQEMAASKEAKIGELADCGDDTNCKELAAWSSEFLAANKLRPRPSLLSRAGSRMLPPSGPSRGDSFKSCASDSVGEDEEETPPTGAEEELEHNSDDSECEKRGGRAMFHSFLSARSATFGLGGVSLLQSLGLGSPPAPDEWEFRKGETEHGWDEANGTEVSVRGPDYFADRKKQPSDQSLLEVVHVDLFDSVGDEGYPNVSAESGGVVCELRKAGENRFLFVVNFRMPPLHLAVVLAPRRSADSDGKTAPTLPGAAAGPGADLLRRFVEEMDDAERARRFKIIPWVREGPWLVQKAVGRTPTIIGRSLATEFFQGEGGDGQSACNCFEVSIDVFSSVAAQRVLGLLKGAAKALTMEVFFVLEAQDPSELPERVLGGFRVSHGDLTRTRGPV